MEREERIKEITRKLFNALLECDDFTYEDLVCAIIYLMGVIDRLSDKETNIKCDSFIKSVYDKIGALYELNGYKPA